MANFFGGDLFSGFQSPEKGASSTSKREREGVEVDIEDGKPSKRSKLDSEYVFSFPNVISLRFFLTLQR